MNSVSPAGGDAAALQGGRAEEERHHQPLPGDADGDPGSDRAAQRPQRQAAAGERQPERQAGEPDEPVREEGGGERRKTTPLNPDKLLFRFLLES